VNSHRIGTHYEMLVLGTDAVAKVAIPDGPTVTTDAVVVATATVTHTYTHM